MNEIYDALIIGGGPAGATSALLLAKAQWSVAVVERAHFPRGKVCGEFVSGTNAKLFEALGISDAVRKLAGPAVRSVGLFAGNSILTSEMPRPGASDDSLGRAVGREDLDTLLLARARQAGAIVFQPWSAVELQQTPEAFHCAMVRRETRESQILRAKIVIAAHGSWEPGRLPSQVSRAAMRGSDLLGFKAHFRNTRLPVGLMPLLAFPGGYGGMVHSGRGRVSLSCCIRRDQLERLRRKAPASSAGECLLAHIEQSCSGAREVLSDASQDASWLSAGPIRPGIRCHSVAGIFPVGNAAGEAHPVIAEGISMAMQSAALLCRQLTTERAGVLSGRAIERVARDYAAAWRQNFAPRLWAAAIIANWAMRPSAVACLVPWLRLLPFTLTLGARWSGKASGMVERMREQST